MPLTRVYLALAPAAVHDLASAGEVGPAPLRAHGVTPALGTPGLVTDEEELEHLAWVAATEEASQVAGGSRRVVASADVDASAVIAPDTSDVPSRVEVTVPVPRTRVVSFHVDETPGDSGTADLLWFDVTELADVRALVGGA
ncbi:hypothetical protein KC207_11340 [Phycicoccus sp. BSK3Z-2]|uniref:Uncharacterized protein n=1 Tax=Phycicoccus avicenniae TaxID=2828860 RepID=A0A941I1A7_9MICO|nr:hypothetical protein [Phycicoccus avicenniae]MBR7743884.1 hypothetical protein [Phycicoccus avicenniae]